MKDIKQFGVERLDLIPSHINMRARITNKLREEHLGWDVYDHYDRAAYNKIDYILKKSIGRKFDDVYSEVRPLLSRIHHNRDAYECFITRYVSVPHHFEKGKPMEVCGRVTGGYNRYAKAYYPVRVTLFLEINGYYVTSKGIIKYIDKKWKPFKMKVDHQVYIQREQLKRHQAKLAKLEKERIELVILSMINKPELMRFYISLKSKECSIWREINEYEPKIPKHLGKYSRYMRSYYLTTVRRSYAELRKIQPQIKKLEQGEFNVFFESNAYLYNKQKECHHFESPIKSL